MRSSGNRFWGLLLCTSLLGAGPNSKIQLDSQVVLTRYFAALAKSAVPRTVVFDCSISQAGPHVIEQRHRIYRSGPVQRDEIYYVDGQSLKPPNTRIIRHEDHYVVQRLAPTIQHYAFLFVGMNKTGKHFTYDYKTIALHPAPFLVESVAIDAGTFLPVAIRFKVRGTIAQGSGVIVYARSDRYWVPVLATVNAKLRGHSARERIAWSAYRFPKNLPRSTFQQPRPLPSPSLAPAR